MQAAAEFLTTLVFSAVVLTALRAFMMRRQIRRMEAANQAPALGFRAAIGPIIVDSLFLGLILATLFTFDAEFAAYFGAPKLLVIVLLIAAICPLYALLGMLIGFLWPAFAKLNAAEFGLGETPPWK